VDSEWKPDSSVVYPLPFTPYPLPLPPFSPLMHPNIWQPYTQAKTAADPIEVKSAQGLWLELADGRKIADCISSWWVNLHGHAHPQIVEAIARQAAQLEHVIFAGFTHEPAQQLASQLVARLPENLTRVFYSDNGSTAVEIALKMAYQYWVNAGTPRQRFMAFEGAYHGDMFGTMAVGARSLFSDVFRDLLFEVDFCPYPDTDDGDLDALDREAKCLAVIRQSLTDRPNYYAGIIIEPLVQGVAGMRMCRPEFLQQLRALATEFDTLLIFDEVMTGFGRTGTDFACNRARVQPDLICLSKGITGGFLPLAVTVATEEIYDRFYSDDPSKTLYHGHSYTANPIGCAAALASLELLKQNESVYMQMEIWHRQYLTKLANRYPQLTKLRVMGTISAIDINNCEKAGYLNNVGRKIGHHAIAHGVLLRPLGNVLYLMPPYCITESELAWVYGQIDRVLGEVLD
jgi:adenosylmethionine---8-amino-7-oxononanoate aminotransferase